jgi:hypothetical protein
MYGQRTGHAAQISTRAWLRSCAILVLSLTALFVLVAGAVLADPHPGDGGLISGGEVDLSARPVTAALDLPGMAPGDRVTQGVVVANRGSRDLRYSVSILPTRAASDDLASRLLLTVKVGVTDCSDQGFGRDGTVLFGPRDMRTAARLGVLGDPSHGAQRDDRMLQPSQSETICTQVVLDLNAGNSLQGASTKGGLVFQAEQT